jgi:chemotaxis protein CheX
MKQEYVNPFLAPAKLVWERELGLPLELSSVSAVAHKFTTEDITAVIGVSGELVGNVLYGFPKSTARGIIDIMVGDDSDVGSELALSALGELANMITGNAATVLSSSGFSCMIAPPVLIQSSGTEISTLGRPQLLVVFGSEAGDLNIRVSLSEGK